MIVHFAAPTPGYERNIEKYKQIARAIESLGYVPTRSISTDISTMIEMGMSILDQEEWELVCEREIEMLSRCDVAIFDTADRATFGIGYQAALSLAAEKPTLLLEDRGGPKGSFISGLKHPQLSRAAYTNDAVEDLVLKFLRGLG